MALLKFENIKKMDKKERENKFNELRFELVKANVTANKSNAKTKEIKKAIARLITFNKSNKEKLKNN